MKCDRCEEHKDTVEEYLLPNGTYEKVCADCCECNEDMSTYEFAHFTNHSLIGSK